MALGTNYKRTASLKSDLILTAKMLLLENYTQKEVSAITKDYKEKTETELLEILKVLRADKDFKSTQKKLNKFFGF